MPGAVIRGCALGASARIPDVARCALIAAPTTIARAASAHAVGAVSVRSHAVRVVVTVVRHRALSACEVIHVTHRAPVATVRGRRNLIVRRASIALLTRPLVVALGGDRWAGGGCRAMAAVGIGARAALRPISAPRFLPGALALCLRRIGVYILGVVVAIILQTAGAAVGVPDHVALTVATVRAGIVLTGTSTAVGPRPAIFARAHTGLLVLAQRHTIGVLSTAAMLINRARLAGGVHSRPHLASVAVRTGELRGAGVTVVPCPLVVALARALVPGRHGGDTSGLAAAVRAEVTLPAVRVSHVAVRAVIARVASVPSLAPAHACVLCSVRSHGGGVAITG